MKAIKAILLPLLGLIVSGVHAKAAFPDTPTKLIVPVDAGGGVDTA